MTLDIDFDSDITYENEFPTQNLQLCDHSQITVKSIRNTFLEWELNPKFPYLENSKFELSSVPENLNPFKNIRKCLHMPRDRFFKFRILHGDIFCNERMFKFKMVNSQSCNYCNTEVESIKHMLWDCPRAQGAWNYLRQLINQAYSDEYINYETIIVGSHSVIPLLETLILLTLKAIIVKDRSNLVSIESLQQKFKTQFFIERLAMKNKKESFKRRWSRLEPILFGNRN